RPPDGDQRRGGVVQPRQRPAPARPPARLPPPADRERLHQCAAGGDRHLRRRAQAGRLAPASQAAPSDKEPPMSKPTAPAPLCEKAVVYEPGGREFSMWLDGIIVGYAPTRQEAEETLDELVYDLLNRGHLDAKLAA